MTTKKCSKCKEVKPLDEFYKNKHTKSGIFSRCKNCCSEYRKNPEVRERIKKYRKKQEVKNKRLKHEQKPEVKNKLSKYHKKYREEIIIFRKYNITKKAYHQMLLSQKNKCAICDTIMEKPCIDHCHTTGKVRGILCFSCNMGIGFLKDNIKNLKSAIKYLNNK